MDHKILVALDGSKEAEAILPRVTRLARDLRAKIVLLGLIVPPDLDGPELSMARYGPIGTSGNERLGARVGGTFEEL